MPSQAARRDLIRCATNIKPADATCAVIERYLQAAVFATPRKLASLFKLLMDESEVIDAIDGLARSKKAGLLGKFVVHPGNQESNPIGFSRSELDYS